MLNTWPSYLTPSPLFLVGAVCSTWGRWSLPSPLPGFRDPRFPSNLLATSSQSPLLVPPFLPDPLRRASGVSPWPSCYSLGDPIKSPGQKTWPKPWSRPWLFILSHSHDRSENPIGSTFPVYPESSRFSPSPSSLLWSELTPGPPVLQEQSDHAFLTLPLPPQSRPCHSSTQKPPLAPYFTQSERSSPHNSR